MTTTLQAIAEAVEGLRQVDAWIVAHPTISTFPGSDAGIIHVEPQVDSDLAPLLAAMADGAEGGEGALRTVASGAWLVTRRTFAGGVQLVLVHPGPAAVQS